MSLTVREGSVGSDPGTKPADASNEGKPVSVRFWTLQKTDRKRCSARIASLSWGKGTPSGAFRDQMTVQSDFANVSGLDPEPIGVGDGI
jgi:hypothetical protein